MISFYPGPSKVYSELAIYLQDAMKEGILSQNHRSQAFMEMMKECIRIFKIKQNIPEDYKVYFTSSATECWEIVAQSLVKKHSHHVFNGAFGEKWFDYASRINNPKINAGRVQNPASVCLKFNFQEKIDSNSLKNIDSEIVCFTQNETSNATQIDLNFLEKTQNQLIAIDVTSSLGGIELDWKLGDIWLASCQKCLGLPAGLGILICSPKALKRAEEIGERNHYNSLLFIQENFQKYQTHYTPNVLSIYLLMRVMHQVPDIQTVSSKTKTRAAGFYNFIENETSLKLLVKNKEVRSETVIAIEGSVQEISQIKHIAKENNITLGNGYGNWKDTTFRIANFPAIEDWEFEKLKIILKS